MLQSFNRSRNEPTLVRIADLRAQFGSDRQMVEVGGSSIRELREDFYDNALNTAGTAAHHIVRFYDIALSGGDPYRIWH